MLDVRLLATALALTAALMSVALAEPAKDKLHPTNAQSAVEARPVRVVLPAPWEAKQPEVPSPGR
jgi:hypothetical protein